MKHDMGLRRVLKSCRDEGLQDIQLWRLVDAALERRLDASAARHAVEQLRGAGYNLAATALSDWLDAAPSRPEAP